MATYSQQWVDDCQRWWGETLTGAMGHWCPDWDFLPIDADCDEFQCCTCDKKALADKDIEAAKSESSESGK